MPLAMAGSAGGGAFGESKRDLAPSGRLQEGGLRKAAGEGVGCELNDDLGLVSRPRHGMQVRISSGSEKLVAEQERDMFRGASAVEQINRVNLTGKHHPTGIGA